MHIKCLNKSTRCGSSVFVCVPMSFSAPVTYFSGLRVYPIPGIEAVGIQGRKSVTEKDLFSVTVSRINEGPRDEPYLTMNAHTVELKPDGTFWIKGEKNGRGFSAGLWDGFEVKRLQDLKTG